MLYKDLSEFKEKYYIFKKRYEAKDLYEVTDLCRIMDKNRSDKSYPIDVNEKLSNYKKLKDNKERAFHNYTLFYDTFFNKFRDEKISIFEVGMGSNNADVPGYMGVNARPGASLYGWSEYFRKANIYGGDIDKRILFKDNQLRIESFYMDQINSSDVTSAFDAIGQKVDIIIDDGMHRPRYNKGFFDNSISYLADGGLFIIEDLFLNNHSKNLREKHYDNLKYIQRKVRFADILKMKTDFAGGDNNLLVILK